MTVGGIFEAECRAKGSATEAGRSVPHSIGYKSSAEVYALQEKIRAAENYGEQVQYAGMVSEDYKAVSDKEINEH